MFLTKNVPVLSPPCVLVLQTPPKSNVSTMPGDDLALLKKSTEEELGEKMGTIRAGEFCVDPFIDSFMSHLIVPERLHPHVTSYLSAFLSQHASS